MGAYQVRAEIPEKIRKLFEESMEQELEWIVRLGKTEEGYYRYLCYFKEIAKIAEIEPLPKENLVRVRYSSIVGALDL